MLDNISIYSGLIISLAIFLIALVIFFLRRDCRREMIWSGFLMLPLLLLLLVFSQNLAGIFEQTNVPHLLLLTLGIFSIGAVFSAIYQILFRHHFAKDKHPESHLLLYLIAGPIFLLILSFIPHLRFAYAICTSLLLDLLILAIFKRDLIVDAIYSGLAMAVVYSCSLIVLPYVLPGRLNDFWFGPISGFNILSTPVEELIIIVLFGLLMGPLYVAANAIYTKR